MVHDVNAFEPDDRVSDFTTSLSAYARKNYAGGQVTHSHLIAALNSGWSPRELARECSRDLPTSQAWAAIQRRLEWCAKNPPASGPATVAKPAAWCGRCDDPSFRFIVDADSNPVRPCPDCSPQRATAGRPA